jgi:hypothetical protein
MAAVSSKAMSVRELPSINQELYSTGYGWLN